MTTLLAAAASVMPVIVTRVLLVRVNVPSASAAAFVPVKVKSVAAIGAALYVPEVKVTRTEVPPTSVANAADVTAMGTDAAAALVQAVACVAVRTVIELLVVATIPDRPVIVTTVLLVRV